MTDKKYNLPPRKWYTLEQAIKRIQKLTGEELEIADLLHYWYLGKLELSVYISKNGNDDFQIGKHNFTKEEYMLIEKPIFVINTNGEIELEGEADKSEFEIKHIFSKLSFDDFITYRGLISIYSSIWNSVDIEEEIIEKGICLSFANQLFSAKHPDTNSRMSFYLKITDFKKSRNSYLEPKDLFILSEHLNDFVSGKGGNEIETIEEITNKKKPSQTIQENQINFIRALLYMDYGISTPNEAKNALNTGKLGQKIEKFRRENPEIETEKNFKFPSSVTLSNWYSKA